MKTNIVLPFTLGLVLILFSCKKDKPELLVKDIDGNTYKTIKIGDQIWMAENLKTHKLNDGTPIAYVTSNQIWADLNILDPMMCYYDNDVANKNKYGALYNRYAVNSGKLAPKGWHVATTEDWEKMKEYLIANGYNYDGSFKNDKVAKSVAAKEGWIEDPNMGNVGNDQITNNKSGFCAVPAGIRYENGSFHNANYLTSWWSATMFNPLQEPGYSLYYNDYFISSDYRHPRFGLSVRCVKD